MTETLANPTPAIELATAGDLRVLRRAVVGSRVACAMVFVGAGSWLDPPGRSGVAHLYEHAFFAGAGPYRDAAAVADAIADLGCRFNAHTHREYSYFYLSGPSTTARAALDLLLASYAEPRWDEDELQKQRTAMLGELRLAAGQHQRRLRDLAARALYGDAPTGRSPLGEADEIPALTADDLRRYAVSATAPGRVTIVLDGDPAAWGDLDDVVDAVTAATSRPVLAAPSGATRPLPSPVPTYAPAGGVHLDVDAKVALLAVVVPGVSYELSRREMHAMRLLHTVVGGGASSRLQRLLRDRLGMSYQVRSSLEPHQRTGALLAILGCAPDRAGEAVVTVRKALGEAVDEPVTPAELARAREVSRGTHVHERETAVDRCFGVAYDLFRRGDVASDDAVFDLWGEIDAAEIQATARRHLRLDEARYVVVGPAEARQSIDATGAVDRWTDV